MYMLAVGATLVWAQVCFSQQPGPEEVYLQYRMILSTSDEKSRKQIDINQSVNKASITFEVEEENLPKHFKNKPSVDSVATIEKTIEEVHF